MERFSAGSLTVRNTEVPIYVDSMGRWAAEHAGQAIYAPTRDELETKLAAVMKKTARKVSVPFVRIELAGRDLIAGVRWVRRGVATGLHSGNGNVLATMADGSKDQITGWGGADVVFMGDVGDNVIAEFQRLRRAQSEAVAAYNDFIRRHSIRLKDAVSEALESPEA